MKGTLEGETAAAVEVLLTSGSTLVPLALQPQQPLSLRFVLAQMAHQASPVKSPRKPMPVKTRMSPKKVNSIRQYEKNFLLNLTEIRRPIILLNNANLPLNVQFKTKSALAAVVEALGVWPSPPAVCFEVARRSRAGKLLTTSIYTGNGPAEVAGTLAQFEVAEGVQAPVPTIVIAQANPRGRKWPTALAGHFEVRSRGADAKLTSCNRADGVGKERRTVPVRGAVHLLAVTFLGAQVAQITNALCVFEAPRVSAVLQTTEDIVANRVKGKGERVLN